MATAWTKRDIPSQAGKRIIVTGANSGIGWHTALELARAGAEVTIASRNLAKVEEAAKGIRSALPSTTIRAEKLDLSDPGSVKAFAERELAREAPLDMLVNNAGVMALADRRLTSDGHEMQFATNVLGPYRLTGLLLPELLRAKAPRVVTVASNTHKVAKGIPLDDLDSQRGYKPIGVYGWTKLANVLVARELQRRAGDRLMSTISHPGAAMTNLFADTSLPMKLACLAIYPLIQKAEMGAEPTLMAATLPNPTPGGYYGPGGFMELRGHPVEGKISDVAADAFLGAALFDRLEKLTGVDYAFN